MNTKTLFISLLVLAGMFSRDTSAQELQRRWGIGLAFSAQRFFPEGMNRRFGLGYGLDGSLSYRFINRLGLSLTAGYNPLRFAIDRRGTSSLDFLSHMFFGDLKLDYDMERGVVRPYVTAGVGILTFVATGDSIESSRFNNGIFLVGGAGLRFILRPNMILDLGVNYKHSSDVDFAAGLQNDEYNSFLGLRAGMTYLLDKHKVGAPVKTEAPLESGHWLATSGFPMEVDSLATQSSYNQLSYNLVGLAPTDTMLTDEQRGRREAVQDSSTAANDAVFDYRPYTDGEIREKIQQSLALDDCIRIALGKNITLRLAASDVAKAEASLSGSYGKFVPLFTMEGAQENTRQKLPLNPLTPTDPTRLNFNNNALGGSVQQTLPSGAIVNFSGDLRRDLNSPSSFGAPPTRSENLAYALNVTQPLLRGAWSTVARSEITLAQNDRQIQDQLFLDTKLKTIYSVKRAFYRVVLQRELIKVNQIATNRDSVLMDVSETMMRAKRASRRDILSAKIRLADDRAALIRSQTEYQAALDNLKEVVGLPIEQSIMLAESPLSFVPVSLDEHTLLRRLIDNNPSVQSAQVSIKRAELSHQIAKNALLPQLDLSVSHTGDLNSDTDQNKDLWTTGWLAGFRFSYPLFSREADAAADRAQITVSQEQNRLANLQRQITLTIRSIVREAHSTAEELNALQGTITAAEEKVDYANTMFNLGRTSNLDVTDAQQDLLKAQNDYLGKVVDYYTQLALLESLTGQPLTP